MKEEKKYSKMKIIELVKKYGELENIPVQSALEEALQNTIKFLESKSVQEVLEQENSYISGNFFYNTEMNLTKAKGKAYQGYDYNLIDAMFLATLLSLYNQSLFKKLRNQSKIENPEEEEQDWISAFRGKLSLFQTVWEENNENKRLSWEILSINLESLFYRFTLPHNLKGYAKELQNNLYTLIDSFEGLPDHHKIAFYNQSLKNRVSFMQEALDKYIQSLNIEEYDEYKSYKKLVEIDKKFEKWGI